MPMYVHDNRRNYTYIVASTCTAPHLSSCIHPYLHSSTFMHECARQLQELYLCRGQCLRCPSSSRLHTSPLPSSSGRLVFDAAPPQAAAAAAAPAAAAADGQGAPAVCAAAKGPATLTPTAAARALHEGGGHQHLCVRSFSTCSEVNTCHSASISNCTSKERMYAADDAQGGAAFTWRRSGLPKPIAVSVCVRVCSCFQ